jgi:hypothetical protein
LEPINNFLTAVVMTTYICLATVATGKNSMLFNFLLKTEDHPGADGDAERGDCELETNQQPIVCFFLSENHQHRNLHPK